MSKLNISQIVSSSVLQKLPDCFFKATKFATGIHDLQGNLLTQIAPSCYNEFCRGMFFSSEGHARCVASNIHGEKVAYKRKEAYVYECHAGLTDVAAPVIVNGQRVASVSAGQVFLEEPTVKTVDYICKKMKGLPGAFIEKQVTALYDVRVVSEDQIQAVAEMLSSIANSIVDLVLLNIKEKEINEQNHKLINSIRFKAMLENEMHDANIRLRDAEFNLLQAQVNPHFLYNTLDSIHWLAILHGTSDIQQMVSSLSSLLRQSLDISNPIVKVKQEIENVKNYLYIQKIRFGDLVNYEINIAEDALNASIPKLILQPLVENALKHGIEPKGKPGKISIVGKKAKNGDYQFKVVDDGVGIEENYLLMLRKLMKNQENSPVQNLPEMSGHGIGLMNVHKRLIHYNGDNSKGLTISSKRNVGTNISFLLSPNVAGRQGNEKE